MTRTMLAAFLFSALLGGTGRAVDITTCSATIPEGQTGVLQADLACPPGVSHAVAIEDGATLVMNGHSIANTGNFGGGSAVRCHGRRCRIVGPGEISGEGSSPVGAFVGIAFDYYFADGAEQRFRLDVSQVSIHHTRIGIEDAGGFALVKARDVTVADCTQTGISVGTLRARNVVSDRNERGVVGLRVRAVGLSTSDNNSDGILVSGSVAVTDLTATGNGGFGVWSGSRLRLRRSTVTGNDGMSSGFDIASGRRPVVVDTTCGRSFMLVEPFGDWDVCTND